MIASALWEIMSSITSKESWYSKVWDKEIQIKWFEELSNQYGNNPSLSSNFWTAIHILKATSQGSDIKANCGWGDDNICEKCVNKIQGLILKDPVSYGYNTTDNFEDIFGDSEYLNDFDHDDYCKHPMCLCSSPDHILSQYVLYLPANHLPVQLREKLKLCFQEMMETLPIDWHPGSNNQVRDLIHPSLYPYVKGVSALKNGTIEECVTKDHRY